MTNHHTWHPCTRLGDLNNYPPLQITSAQGCFIQLSNGKTIIDAISSWWCKHLGHGHPRLKAALKEQSDRFEHVILANTTHDVIETLSARLSRLSPGLEHVFYASDGSSAVEIAMKMSLHSRLFTGEHQRQRWMTLSNSYHGETGLALSASDSGDIYRKPYAAMLIDIPILKGIPYVTGKNDPLWHDCSAYWPDIEKQLIAYSNTLTAIIVEPIVQGAAGMLIYSQDFLRRLRLWTTQHGIHLIADEIMTGLGRTGSLLACQHANIHPDFVCVGKGLTSGWLPLSAVLISSDIYSLFCSQSANEQPFLHSHTFGGNALAASVANACLQCIEDENIIQRVNQQAPLLQQAMQSIADDTGLLKNVRGIGAIAAADLSDPNRCDRPAFKVCQRAIQLGALLRPLGNTLYWLPPLTIDEETIESLAKITKQAIVDTLLK